MHAINSRLAKDQRKDVCCDSTDIFDVVVSMMQDGLQIVGALGGGGRQSAACPAFFLECVNLCLECVNLC